MISAPFRPRWQIEIEAHSFIYEYNNGKSA